MGRWVAALTRLRQGGLHPGAGPSWCKLLRCAGELPACLPLEDLSLWSRQALPQRLSQRPPFWFWADVMAVLARAGIAPQPAKTVASATLQRPRASEREPNGAPGATDAQLGRLLRRRCVRCHA